MPQIGPAALWDPLRIPSGTDPRALCQFRLNGSLSRPVTAGQSVIYGSQLSEIAACRRKELLIIKDDFLYLIVLT